jgi:hypothetical protein
MADKKQARDATIPGGNSKSDGKGGGKSRSGGANVDPVGNARLKGQDPSPDDRTRGSRSPEART